MFDNNEDDIITELSKYVPETSLANAIVDVATLGLKIAGPTKTQEDVDEFMNLALIGKLVINGGLRLA